jgi:hypothetical protein
MAMNETERQGERRRQNAFERLGTNNPRCVVCGETDWRCLELHHLPGRGYGDELVIVCRNCHRKLSDMQKDHPASSKEPSDPLEIIGRFLLGMADLLELLIAKLREFGRALVAQARSHSNSEDEVRS